ncbi:MAG: thiamine pyrophosphate-binding protein [Verrucomicrobiota bacterium]
MLVGGAAMHLNESVGRRSGELEYIANLHEQACSIAAEAYARVTGTLGLAVVTAGPGSTNAITGVAGAYLDSTPCFFISGQVKTADLKALPGQRQNGVQEIDITSIVGPITKYAVTIRDPKSIRYEMEKALYLAKSGRPGPVWIDIPIDSQGAQIDPEQLRGFTPDTPPDISASLSRAVAGVIEALNRSERPILLLGNGIRVADGVQTVQQLIERLRIPVLTTWLGLDLIPDNHPYFVGRPGAIAPRGANFALQNCDCLLVIGSRLDMALTGYAHDKFARAAEKIMVDVDANEIRKMKTLIHHPIVADAKAFMEELLRQADSLQDGRDRSPWMNRCAEWKSKYPLLRPEHYPAPGRALSMYYFSDKLWSALREGEIVVPGSSGFASEIFFLMTKAKRGQRIFHNRGTGSMGFAIPAAIGACLASGRKRIVSVDGDGGFQMNIQELATIATHNLPIKFFVVNNNGYACIRASQSGYFNGHLVGADTSSGVCLPSLEKVTLAYDLHFERIASGDAIEEKIRQVLDFDGPVVCEVVVQPDEARVPRLASIQRPDGSMVSKPLEDLFPFLDREEFKANMIVPIIDEPM